MSIRHRALLSSAALTLTIILSACFNPLNPNPQPVGLTPIPTLAPAATLTLVSALQATPVSGGGPASGTTSQVSASLGAAIFLQHCSPCHGVLGEGVIGPALRNSQYIQTAGDPAIIQTISTGRPGTQMPAWLQANGGPLNISQISSVVDFLHTLQKVSPVPSATQAPPGPTDTPLPPNAPTPAPARPSNPGGPGTAVTLTGDIGRGRVLFGQNCAVCHGPEGLIGAPDPGSDDGSVPTLNPIDPTIANSDLKVFAANVDRFIEHGSIPSGPSPLLMMPSFGDSKMLSPQQIADLIAYVISLNSTK